MRIDITIHNREIDAGTLAWQVSHLATTNQVQPAAFRFGDESALIVERDADGTASEPASRECL